MIYKCNYVDDSKTHIASWDFLRVLSLEASLVIPNPGELSLAQLLETDYQSSSRCNVSYFQRSNYSSIRNPSECVCLFLPDRAD
jgi:hypothetical protein